MPPKRSPSNGNAANGKKTRARRTGADRKERGRSRIPKDPKDAEIQQTKDALEKIQQSFGPESPVALGMTFTLGKLYRRHNMKDEAMVWLNKAMEGFQKLENHSSFLDAKESIADILVDKGDMEEGLKIYDWVIKEKEKTVAEAEPTSTEMSSFLGTMHRIGKLYATRGESDKALQLFAKVLAGREKAQVAEDSSELIEIVGDMAELYAKKKDYVKAVDFYERALKANPKRFDGVEETYKIFRNMAKTLKTPAVNRLSEALSYAQRSVDGFRTNLGDSNPSTIKSVQVLASIYDALKNYAKAEECYLEALQGFQVLSEKEFKYAPKVVKITQSLAKVAAHLNNHATAMSRYEDVLRHYAEFPDLREKALEIAVAMAKSFPNQEDYSRHRFLQILESYHLEEHENVLGAFHDIAKRFTKLRRYDESMVWFEKALVGFIAAKGKADALPLEILQSMMDAFKQSKTKSAGDQLKKALSLFGEDCPVSALDALLALARSFNSTRPSKESRSRKDQAGSQQQDSIDWLRFALKRFQEHPEKTPDDCLAIMKEIAQTMAKAFRYDDALEQYGRILSECLESKKKDDEAVLEVMKAGIAIFPRCNPKSYELNHQRLNHALGLFQDELHPTILAALKDMAETFLIAKQQPKAYSWFDKLILAFEKSPSKGSEEHLALLESLRKTAKSLKDERGMPWYNRALVGYTAVLPEDKTHAVEIIREMTAVVVKGYDANIEAYRKALKLFEATYNQQPLGILAEFAATLASSNLHKQGLEWYLFVLAAYEKSDDKGSKEHVDVLESMRKSSKSFKDDRTMLWLGRVLTGYIAAKPDEDKAALEIVNEMATIVQKNYDAYIDAFRKALTAIQDAYKTQPLKTLATLANALASNNQLRPAWEWYRHLFDAHEKSDQKGSPAHLAVVKSVTSKALQLKQNKDSDKALEWLRAAQSSIESFDMNSAELPKISVEIAAIYNSKGDSTRAMECYNQILDKWSADVGVDILVTVLEAFISSAKHSFARKQYADSLQLFNQVIEKCEKHASDNASIVALKKNVFQLIKALGTRLKGIPEQGAMAQEWLERALSGFDGEGDPETLEMIFNIAVIYRKKDERDKAYEWFERALKGYEKADTIAAKNTAVNVLLNMAWIVKMKPDFDQALNLYVRALEFAEIASGTDSPLYATVYDAISNSALDFAGVKKADYGTALKWHSKCLEVTKNKHSKTSSKRYSDSLKHITATAASFRAKKEHTLALEWYQAALSAYDGPYSNTNPDALKITNNIAATYKESGNLDKAEEWYKKALKNFESCPRDARTGMDVTVHRLSAVYKEKDAPDKALQNFVHALSLYGHTSKEYGVVLGAMQKAAQEYSGKGEYPEAFKWYTASLDGCERLNPPGKLSKEYADILREITSAASSFRDKKEFARALEWFEFALSACQKVLGDSHPEAVRIVKEIAATQNMHGEAKKALETYDRALNDSKKGGASMYNTIVQMTTITLGMKDYDKTMELYDKALATASEGGIGKQSPYLDILIRIRNVAGSLAQENDYEKAVIWFKKCHSGYAKAGNKVEIIQAATSVAACYREQANFKQALEWYSQALDAARGRKEFGDTMALVCNVANKFFNDKKYNEADEWLSKALAEYSTGKAGTFATEKLSILGKLAVIAKEKKDFAKALQHYNQSLNISAAASQKRDLSETLKIIAAQAKEFRESKDVPSAVEWYEKALAGYRKQSGLHTDMLDIAFTLAAIAREGGDQDKAFRYYNRILSDCENAGKSPQQYFTTLETISTIAEEHRKAKEYPKSLEWLTRALNSYQKHPEQFAKTLATILTMAQIAKEMDDVDSALQHCTRALKTCETLKRPAKEQLGTLTFICSVGEELKKAKNFKKALEWFGKALPVYVKIPDQQSTALDTVLKMAEISKEINDHDGALRYFERALVICETGGRVLRDYVQVLGTICTIAAEYRAAKDFTRAIQWYNRALVAYEKPGHQTSFLSTLLSVAEITKEMKEYDKLLQHYNRALEICERAVVPLQERAQILASITAMAKEFQDEGNFEKALLWYKRAAKGYEQADGKDSIDFKNISAVLEEVAPLAPEPKSPKDESKIKGSPRIGTKPDDKFSPPPPPEGGMRMLRRLSMTITKKESQNFGEEVENKQLRPDKSRERSPRLSFSMSRRNSHLLVDDKEVKPRRNSLLAVGEKDIKPKKSGKSKERSRSQSVSKSKRHEVEEVVEVVNPIKKMEADASQFKKEKDYIKALKLYRDVLELREKELGEQHATSLAAKMNIATVLTKQGRLEEAMETYGQTLQLHAQSVRRPTPLTKKSLPARCLKRMASLISKCKSDDYPNLTLIFSRALSITGLERTAFTLALTQKLGKRFLKHSDVDKAHEWFSRGLSIAKRLRGQDKARFEIILGLARSAAARGGAAELEKAALLGLQAAKGLEKALGRNDKTALRAMKWVTKIKKEMREARKSAEHEEAEGGEAERSRSRDSGRSGKSSRSKRSERSRRSGSSRTK